ncbi:hypothetical protein [Burkholderia pseudomallei]
MSRLDQRGRHLPEPFRKAAGDEFACLVVMPNSDHLPQRTAFRRIQIEAQANAAAVVRKWNPFEVVPVIFDDLVLAPM